MQYQTDENGEPGVHQLLDAGEEVRAETRARDALLALTDRRLIVVEYDRVRLNLPFERLRRVQFDVERARPATLVIVPDHVTDEPQVLVVPPEEYPAAATALAVIGEQLAKLD